MSAEGKLGSVIAAALFAVACGDTNGSPDGSTPEECTSDLSCSDGLFCNGVERCAPAGAGADERGCVADAAPCAASQSCEEASDTCVTECAVERDADGDAIDAIECGGNDCDDSDPQRFPGNTEVCDADDRDEDCNPATAGFRDQDLDGYADARCCNGTMCGNDCDDARQDVHPTESEMCDTVDNDCDSLVDESGAGTFYRDDDADGYGTIVDMMMGATCTAPLGYALRPGDCDDARAEANPGATELCNDDDEDCDGLVDEDASASCDPGLGCVAGDCTRNVRAISAGYTFSCAVRASGQAVCWGSSENGQLGYGGNTASRVPIDVTGLSNAVDISAGGGTFSYGCGTMTCTARPRHACAVTNAGAVLCWGSNTSGQLGSNDTVQHPAPVAVMFAADAIEVCTGERHSCAVRSTGSVDCWGFDGPGSLGDGTAGGERLIAAPVPGLVDATAIACGDYGNHTCALRATREVVCWGEGSEGQLGNGTRIDSPSPVPVMGLVDAVAISAGLEHSCAVRAGGEVVCWGSNGSGRLGIATTLTRSTTPIDVAWIAGATQVSCGNEHTCAIVAPGNVRCWGNGGQGRLGNDMTTNSAMPVDVMGITDAVEVSAGAVHTCAALQTGDVMCWGENGSGQLGDSTATDRHSPVAVVDLP